jgi:uncharacterized membrane protein (DUF106 family)
MSNPEVILIKEDAKKEDIPESQTVVRIGLFSNMSADLVKVVMKGVVDQEELAELKKQNEELKKQLDMADQRHVNDSLAQIQLKCEFQEFKTRAIHAECLLSAMAKLAKRRHEKRSKPYTKAEIQ